MVYGGLCVLQVDDEVANVLVAQLLYLAQEDKEKDITLYINRYPPSPTPPPHLRLGLVSRCAAVV